MIEGCGRHRPLRRHCEERLRRSNPESLHGGSLDCFAEPVIGPRFARTRWLAMTGWKATAHLLSCPGQAATRERCGAEPGPRRPRGALLHGAPALQRIAKGGAALRPGHERRIHLAFLSRSHTRFPVLAAHLPELCFDHRPRRCRGRREGRAPAGTRGPLCANTLETNAQRHTGQPGHPGLPCAVVLRLMS